MSLSLKARKADLLNFLISNYNPCEKKKKCSSDNKWTKIFFMQYPFKVSIKFYKLHCKL